MRKEFEEKNDRLWNAKINELFQGNIPSEYTWTNADEIVNVLNYVGSNNGLNHTFFPQGGGLDLTGCRLSHESGCLELNFGGQAEISKTRSLTFNSFEGENHKWSYFRIESDELKPSGVYENYGDFNNEELMELNPCEYYDRGIWDYGYLGSDENGNPKKFPDYARVISRSFRGSYVIFSKSSYYNQISKTYNGIHNRMSSIDFKAMIQKTVDMQNAKK